MLQTNTSAASLGISTATLLAAALAALDPELNPKP